MQKITITAFIVSAAALLYALISVLLIEKKPENTDSKKAEKFSKLIQKGTARLFSEPHQEIFIIAVISAIVMAVSIIGVKSAAAFIAGIVFALAIEKITLKIISALILRANGQYEKGRKNGIGIILASASIAPIFATGLILLALAAFYGIIKDVNLILPFALGISVEAVFVKIFSGIFIKTAENSGIENLKNISGGAGIAASGVEFTENLMMALGAAMVIGALTPAGLGGRAAILPMALASIISAILLLNVFIFKAFKQSENFIKTENVALIGSALLMFAGSFFAVKMIIGSIQLFWPIAIGIALGLVLKILQKDVKNPWKLAAYLGVIYFALTIALKFDGINALVLAVIGAISILSVSFANNYVSDFAEISAEAAENSAIKKDIQERFSAFSFKKVRQSLDEMSMLALFALFVLFSYLSGVKNISLEAGRTLFALLAGGLISFFAYNIIKDAIKSIKNKISGQNIDFSESGAFKLLFNEISRTISGKELVVIAAIVGAPIVTVVLLGMHALVALFAGMIIAAFALQESEVISAIKFVLISMIVLLPVL